MGRRTTAMNEAISTLIECGMTSMTSQGFDYEYADFTEEDVQKAYLIILKRLGLE